MVCPAISGMNSGSKFRQNFQIERIEIPCLKIYIGWLREIISAADPVISEFYFPEGWLEISGKLTSVTL
jgi:hypothetical protein